MIRKLRNNTIIFISTSIAVGTGLALTATSIFDMVNTEKPVFEFNAINKEFETYEELLAYVKNVDNYKNIESPEELWEIKIGEISQFFKTEDEALSWATNYFGTKNYYVEKGFVSGEEYKGIKIEKIKQVFKGNNGVYDSENSAITSYITDSGVKYVHKDIDDSLWVELFETQKEAIDDYILKKGYVVASEDFYTLKDSTIGIDYNWNTLGGGQENDHDSDYAQEITSYFERTITKPLKYNVTRTDWENNLLNDDDYSTKRDSWISSNSISAGGLAKYISKHDMQTTINNLANKLVCDGQNNVDQTDSSFTNLIAKQTEFNNSASAASSSVILDYVDADCLNMNLGELANSKATTDQYDLLISSYDDVLFTQEYIPSEQEYRNDSTSATDLASWQASNNDVTKYNNKYYLSFSDADKDRDSDVIHSSNSYNKILVTTTTKWAFKDLSNENSYIYLSEAVANSSIEIEAKVTSGTYYTADGIVASKDKEAIAVSAGYINLSKTIADSDQNNDWNTLLEYSSDIHYGLNTRDYAFRNVNERTTWIKQNVGEDGIKPAGGDRVIFIELDKGNLSTLFYAKTENEAVELAMKYWLSFIEAFEPKK